MSECGGQGDNCNRVVIVLMTGKHDISFRLSGADGLVGEGDGKGWI